MNKLGFADLYKELLFASVRSHHPRQKIQSREREEGPGKGQEEAAPGVDACSGGGTARFCEG